MKCPDISWVDNHIEITPPKKTKKLTATRFATVLGLNPWATPFEIWCAVTKTWEKPFVDTIYTRAGKVIEPKQAEYMRKAYFMQNLKTPEDIYGKDYFNKTYGDFYADTPILGGMWDYLLYDEDGKPTTVLEMKTTKRAEDWQGVIPEYYALQASLYAYLLGVDNVVMVASFLSPSDYDHPEDFVLTADNTITHPFRVSERYPTFEQDYVRPALDWWNTYVKTGVSPDFDEKSDAEILKALRTNTFSPDTNMEELLAEVDAIQTELDEITSETAEKKKRLKQLKEIIKKCAIEQFRDGDTTVSIAGKKFEWVVTKAQTSSIDKEQLEQDGLLEKYQTVNQTYKISHKNREDI